MFHSPFQQQTGLSLYEHRVWSMGNHYGSPLVGVSQHPVFMQNLELTYASLVVFLHHQILLGLS